MTSLTPSGREGRRSAAARFQPDHVRLLLLAEAPPASPDRYFYFPHVWEQDSLFRYVVRFTLGLEPTRVHKEALLGALRDVGVFLIDVCLDPIFGKSELKACLPDLIARAKALKPDNIILIKTTVFDTAYLPMTQAGLPVVDARIPFPGSGQQLRFEYEMGLALDGIGWRRPN
jgi:hypothetical protein